MLTVCVEELVSESEHRAGKPYLKMDCTDHPIRYK